MISKRVRCLLVGLVVGACLLAWVPVACGVELWSSVDGDRRCCLTTSLKWTSVLSHAPEDSLLYPEQWSSASLWRLRFTLVARPATWLGAEVAYEQRARLASEDSGAAGGTGILPRDTAAPYRIYQVDEPLVEIGDTFWYRHELDRANATVFLGRGEITVGRQAVGWGRGVFFSAVDVFAPFTPLESDREWRRGIDAVRAVAPLGDLTSIDVVAAVGESIDASALVARLQGYVGDVDGELIFGRRCKDYVCAATASLPILGAELHGELAAFKVVDEQADDGLFGRNDLVGKALLGASYNVGLAGGLLVIGEYHYSGFGVSDIKDLGTSLQDPAFVERCLRGDTQILGRHACAAQVVHGVGGVWSSSALWLFSPVDGSGVITPAVACRFSDNVTLSASAYFGYGAPPEDGELQSEYGGTATSVLVQISFYY